MTRYLILGTGVAAIAAAEAIRSQDAASPLVFIGEDPNGYYSRPGLAYVLTGEVDEKQLFAYRADDFKKLNAQFYRATATRILPGEQAVEAGPRLKVPYDRLLIAVGSQAVRLKAPGVELDGVVKLDHMEDMRLILQKARKAKSAVVVGGGITALELTEGMAAQGVKVHMLIRDERYWPNVLDEIESKIIEKRLHEDGVQIHHKSELDEILGKNGKVRGVRLKSGEEIRCEMFAYAIGVAPRIGLAQEAGINCERGILANQKQETNLPNIYAAGDVAQVFDPLTGKATIDSLWSPAREQGRVAGINMSGGSAEYIKKAPFNVTRLGGLTTTIIGSVGTGRESELVGIARGDSETWRQIPDAIITQSGFEVNRLRLMVGQQHILGALVMGDQKLSSPLETLVREKVDITPIRERLLQPDAPLADILVKFWSTVVN